MKSSDVACPFCGVARRSTPLPLRLARGSRQSVLLAMALGVCGGVVEPPPEKDAAADVPMDAGTKPSFDAFVPTPTPRDASEEVMLPPPIYGGAPPPPSDD